MSIVLSFVSYLERRKRQVCFSSFVQCYLLAGSQWKPSIKYFDFFAQSTKEGNVRQVFPFVKVCCR